MTQSDEDKFVKDSIDGLIKMSNNKEIFNLWYELTYLRMLINHILTKNPEIGKCINEIAILEAKSMAQLEVKSKFPGCDHLFF